ncbi:hypothetical protein BH09VER1_BH09VER1_44690 [soil metagenome]
MKEETATHQMEMRHPGKRPNGMASLGDATRCRLWTSVGGGEYDNFVTLFRFSWLTLPVNSAA